MLKRTSVIILFNGRSTGWRVRSTASRRYAIARSYMTDHNAAARNVDTGGRIYTLCDNSIRNWRAITLGRMEIYAARTGI